jgi:hypothetical protein
VLYQGTAFTACGKTQPSHGIAEKTHTPGSDGQVHPTARSVLSHHPTIHTPRPSIHSESTSLRSILGTISKLPEKLGSFESHD